MTAAEYKRLRVSIGSQPAVAARLGVSETTISRRERGKLPITKEAADAMNHQLCRRLNEKKPRSK